MEVEHYQTQWENQEHHNQEWERLSDEWQVLCPQETPIASKPTEVPGAPKPTRKRALYTPLPDQIETPKRKKQPPRRVDFETLCPETQPDPEPFLISHR